METNHEDSSQWASVNVPEQAPVEVAAQELETVLVQLLQELEQEMEVAAQELQILQELEQEMELDIPKVKTQPSESQVVSM